MQKAKRQRVVYLLVLEVETFCDMSRPPAKQ